MRASFVLGAAAKKPRGRPPRPTGRPPLPKAPVTFPRGTLRKTFSEDSINNLFDHVARSWPESSKAALAHFRQHLVKSVSAPDDEGRLASRNQRQVATVLAHDQNVQLGGNDYLTVKRLYARPSLSNVETARKLISFWRLDQLKDGVVILGNSGSLWYTSSVSEGLANRPACASRSSGAAGRDPVTPKYQKGHRNRGVTGIPLHVFGPLSKAHPHSTDSRSRRRTNDERSTANV